MAVVGCYHHGLVARLYEHALSRLVGGAVTAAEKTIAVLVVSVLVRSIGRWSVILVNMI